MGLKPKDKGHTKFYECCDLTKKVYLTYIYDDHEYKIKRDYMQNKVWLERTSASSRSFFLSKCH